MKKSRQKARTKKDRETRRAQLIDLYLNNPTTQPQEASQTIYGTPRYAKLITKSVAKATRQGHLPNETHQAIIHHLQQHYPHLTIITTLETRHTFTTTITYPDNADTTTITISIPYLHITRTTTQRNIPRNCTIDLTNPDSITQLEQIIQQPLNPKPKQNTRFLQR